MAWYDPSSWFKPKYIQDPSNPFASIPAPSLLSGAIGKADTSFLQGLVRRTKPIAEKTSSEMSLSEYLKIPSPLSQYSYPSSQWTPPAQTVPATQPYLSAMQDRITAGQVAPAQGALPVKEATQPTPQTPFLERMPDPAKATYSQQVTKRGVYMVRRDEFGGETSVFLRENEPGDIFEGEEIYTWQNEWRPLSTEYKMGKGEMYFAPGADYLARLQNRLNQ